MKQLIWLGDSRKRIKGFPQLARNLAGHELDRVQVGASPTDWKSMPIIGSGAIEIRIHQPNEYRVIYVARFPEAIYVLHAFQKQTQRTALIDIERARRRYDNLQETRRRAQKKRP